METMNKKERKATFILIVILLIIFVPLSTFSVYLKATGKDIPKEKENTFKEFFFDGKLWFYNNTGALLGTYKCNNPNGDCNLATIANNMVNYGTDAYRYEEGLKINLINNRYAFLVDSETKSSNNPVFLYDIVSNISYSTSPYRSVSNYGVGIDGNIFIVENMDGLYGLMQIENAPILIIPCTYSYLALQNKQNSSGQIISDKFIGLRDGSWFLTDKKNNILSEMFANEITSFTDNSLITRDSLLQYHLVNYNNDLLLMDDGYVLMKYISDRYVGVYKLSEYFVYDMESGINVTREYSYGSDDVIDARISGNELEILLNNNVVDTLDL